MTIHKTLRLLLIPAFLLVPPPFAHGDGWTLRGWAASVWPTGSLEFADPSGDVDVELGSSLGLGVDLERSLGPRSGLAFGLSTSAPDVEVRFNATAPGVPSFRASDELRATTFSVGALFHLTPHRRFDLFVGPELAWTRFGDLDFDDVDEDASTSVDDHLGFGARLGFDAPVGDQGWGFHTALRWLDLEADLEEAGSGEALDISPWAVHLGFSRTF